MRDSEEYKMVTHTRYLWQKTDYCKAIVAVLLQTTCVLLPDRQRKWMRCWPRNREQARVCVKKSRDMYQCVRRRHCQLEAHYYYCGMANTRNTKWSFPYCTRCHTDRMTPRLSRPGPLLSCRSLLIFPSHIYRPSYVCTPSFSFRFILHSWSTLILCLDNHLLRIVLQAGRLLFH